MKNAKVVNPIITYLGDIQKSIRECPSRVAYVEENAAALAEWIVEEYERRGAKCLSLDVFDTLLLRNNEPEAFRFLRISAAVADYLVQEKNLTNNKRSRARNVALGGIKLTKEVCAAFLARETATNISYRTRAAIDGCREGNIDDILKVQAQILGLNPSNYQALKRIEIDIEASSLVGNLAIANACEVIRTRGGKVIALSDMYLDGPTIEVIIMNCFNGISPVDRVFSSADWVVSKHSKKIFPKIEAVLGLNPNSFLHIGDNHTSDVINSVEAGWAGLHFPVAQHEHESRIAFLEKMIQAFNKIGLDITTFAKV